MSMGEYGGGRIKEQNKTNQKNNRQHQKTQIQQTQTNTNKHNKHKPLKVFDNHHHLSHGSEHPYGCS